MIPIRIESLTCKLKNTQYRAKKFYPKCQCSLAVCKSVWRSSITTVFFSLLQYLRGYKGLLCVRRTPPSSQKCHYHFKHDIPYYISSQMTFHDFSCHMILYDIHNFSCHIMTYMYLLSFDPFWQCNRTERNFQSCYQYWKKLQRKRFDLCQRSNMRRRYFESQVVCARL